MNNKARQFKKIPSLERNPKPLTGNTGTNNKLVKKVARLLVAFLAILVIIFVAMSAANLF
jgi:hypothetical protein